MAGWKRPGWQQFLLDGDCDVWLLTEVDEDTVLAGYDRHLGLDTMTARKRWAGVFSRRPLASLPDPHRASAAAVIDGITLCSTILPWKSSGGEPHWPGGETPGGQHAARMAHALRVLVPSIRTPNLVWGGDWNQALDGPEGAGSFAGRSHILRAVDDLGLKVPTTWLPHQSANLSIDHIAVPRSWSVSASEHRPAGRLSDHDCYVVDVAPR
jgi:hypothetical protein